MSLYSRHFHFQVSKTIGRSSDSSEESRRRREFEQHWQHELEKLARILDEAVSTRSLALIPITREASQKPVESNAPAVNRVYDSTSNVPFKITPDPQRVVTTVAVPSDSGPQSVGVGFWLKPKAERSDLLKIQDTIRTETQKFFLQ